MKIKFNAEKYLKGLNILLKNLRFTRHLELIASGSFLSFHFFVNISILQYFDFYTCLKRFLAMLKL